MKQPSGEVRHGKTSISPHHSRNGTSLAAPWHPVNRSPRGNHKRRSIEPHLMPRRTRASRIPRPAEPPPGYDGPYTSCRKIRMSRRPRPCGAPPPVVVNEVRPCMEQVLPQVDGGSRSSKHFGSTGVNAQESVKSGDQGHLLHSGGKETDDIDGPAAVGHDGTPPSELGAMIVPARSDIESCVDVLLPQTELPSSTLSLPQPRTVICSWHIGLDSPGLAGRETEQN